MYREKTILSHFWPITGGEITVKSGQNDITLYRVHIHIETRICWIDVDRLRKGCEARSIGGDSNTSRVECIKWMDRSKRQKLKHQQRTATERKNGKSYAAVYRMCSVFILKCIKQIAVKEDEVVTFKWTE